MSSCNLTSQNTERLATIIKNHQSDGFFLTFEPESAQGKWYAPTNRPRLLILDSSFNPPTKAHAALLTKALDTQPGYFDASLLLFSTQNVDKTLTGASIIERVEMMELMAKRHTTPHHPVYVGLTHQAKFIDKAKEIQQWHSGVELTFIVGQDTVTRLLDPKYYLPTPVTCVLDPFFNTCRLVCADRPGYGSSSLAQHYADKMTRISLDGAVASISSTLARQAVARVLSGRDDRAVLSQFMDDDVVEYVLGKSLY
ncbi:hypothetical protein BC941DRAFT_438328, partial [Chlamydoabsidia padenii]